MCRVYSTVYSLERYGVDDNMNTEIVEANEKQIGQYSYFAVFEIISTRSLDIGWQ